MANQSAFLNSSLSTAQGNMAISVAEEVKTTLVLLMLKITVLLYNLLIPMLAITKGARWMEVTSKLVTCRTLRAALDYKLLLQADPLEFQWMPTTGVLTNQEFSVTARRTSTTMFFWWESPAPTGISRTLGAPAGERTDSLN